MDQSKDYCNFTPQPTLGALLTTESLAEARIMHGGKSLDRTVVQVVSHFDPSPSPGSLLVLSRQSLEAPKLPSIGHLAGIILVVMPEKEPRVLSGINSTVAEKVESSDPLGQLVKSDISVKRLYKMCREVDVALALVAGFGDVNQMVEDIRLSFLREMRASSARLHFVLMRVVMDEGMEGLVGQLHSWLDRPVCVESAEFEILAAQDMGGTPKRQRKLLAESAQEMIKRFETGEGSSCADVFMEPLRSGRRMSIPILMSGDVIAGFISVMVRPSDNPESLVWYLQPAALAALVDLNLRSSGDFGTSAAHLNLLRDLLSGRNMSAAELERLERHFGFDLHEGFLVFAAQVLPAEKVSFKATVWPRESYVSIEVEGTQVFVVPDSDEHGRP